MAASQPRSDAPVRLVLMGVAGSGKTAVGEALAAATGIRFVDGDALHPAANIAKMTAGIPLTDDDRWPWLAKVGETLGASDGNIAIGCSALKRVYRDYITSHAGAPVLFVYLDGSRELITARMHKRTGHFMPTSLLDSQFATLEPPAMDETAISVSIDASLEQIVASIVSQLPGGKNAQ